ncbi:unnamed protein product [Lampetra fluviatilis]
MSVKIMAPVVVVMMMMVGVMKVSCALNATTNLTLSAVLAPGDFDISWEFDSDQIVLEARVRTQGWVGLGLSSTGMMAGSDLVIGWVDSAAATHLVDAHIEGERSLVRDASQDYKLVGLSENGTHTVMRVVRALRTCDANDRDITEDTVRLIWAYSTDDPKSENMPDVPYHSAVTRGSKSIQLLRQGFPTEQPLPQNYSTFDAVQSQTFDYPAYAGYSLGLDADPKDVMLEIHYNNPQMASGVRDSSGLRLYYTPNLRKYDTGILETGILPNKYHFIPPKATSFKSYGICNTGSFVTANSNDTLQLFCGKEPQGEDADAAAAAWAGAPPPCLVCETLEQANGNQVGNLGRDMGYDFGLQETRYLNNLTAVLPFGFESFPEQRIPEIPADPTTAPPAPPNPRRLRTGALLRAPTEAREPGHT